MVIKQTRQNTAHHHLLLHTHRPTPSRSWPKDKQSLPQALISRKVFCILRMSQTDGEVNTSSSQRYHPLQTGDAPYLKYTGFSFFLCSSGRDHNSRLLPAYVWPGFVWSVWLWGITLSSVGLVAELSPKSYTEAGTEISGGGGRGSLISNSTLSPPDWFCTKMGSGESHF